MSSNQTPSIKKVRVEERTQKDSIEFNWNIRKMMDVNETDLRKVRLIFPPNDKIFPDFGGIPHKQTALSRPSSSPLSIIPLKPRPNKGLAARDWVRKGNSAIMGWTLSATVERPLEEVEKKTKMNRLAVKTIQEILSSLPPGVVKQFEKTLPLRNYHSTPM